MRHSISLRLRFVGVPSFVVGHRRDPVFGLWQVNRSGEDREP